MKIYVKVVNRENQVLTVDVKPTDTVLELKKKIARQKRILITNFRLIVGGRFMMHDSLVKDYGLHEESRIYLLTKLRYA